MEAVWGRAFAAQAAADSQSSTSLDSCQAARYWEQNPVAAYKLDMQFL